MMRSTPRRVKTRLCTAIRAAVPLVEPAANRRILALGVLANDAKSMSSGLRFASGGCTREEPYAGEG